MSFFQLAKLRCLATGRHLVVKPNNYGWCAKTGAEDIRCCVIVMSQVRVKVSHCVCVCVCPRWWPTPTSAPSPLKWRACPAAPVCQLTLTHPQQIQSECLHTHTLLTCIHTQSCDLICPPPPAVRGPAASLLRKALRDSASASWVGLVVLMVTCPST